MRYVLNVLCCLFGLSASLWAHPGHGTTDSGSIAHQVAEPVHLLPLVAGLGVVALLWTASRLLRRRQ